MADRELLECGGLELLGILRGWVRELEIAAEALCLDCDGQSPDPFGLTDGT